MSLVRSRRGPQGGGVLRLHIPGQSGRRGPPGTGGAIHTAPSDYPAGKQGTELTVEFTVLGQKFVGLNGGPNFKPNEAVSFMVLTSDQEETDRYWKAIVGEGGRAGLVRW